MKMNESMVLGGCVVSKNILIGKGNFKWCIRESLPWVENRKQG